MDRRKFINTLGRTAILTGIVASSSWFIFRKPTGEACKLDFVCKTCKKNSSCVLPEATDFRKQIAKR